MATKVSRIQVEGGCCKDGVSISLVEGPDYQDQTEDGPVVRCGQFVVAVVSINVPDAHAEVRGKRFFQFFKWRGDAQARIDAIHDHGSVNLAKWTEGDPWGGYRQGTLEDRLGVHGTEWELEQKERLFNGG